jgi:hypothetical protein
MSTQLGMPFRICILRKFSTPELCLQVLGGDENGANLP